MFSTLLLLSIANAASLSTTSAGGNGSNGAMFDVYAYNTATITDITSYSYSSYSSGCSYYIYYTTSTLSSVLTNSSAWTLLTSGTTGALSAGGTWNVSLPTPLVISAGSRVALYVTFNSSCTIQYTNGSAVGTVYASNSDIAIYQGYGKSYPFGSSFSPRVWNGTITYTTCTSYTWYEDNDGDGYGDPSSTSSACTQPSGYIADATDCDDTNASINPAGQEICDALDADEDCDGVTEDADSSVDISSYLVWYADSDSDGYGDINSTLSACNEPSGYSSDFSDCDDSDSSINPAGEEVCDENNADEDCDGSVDDADSSVDIYSYNGYYVDADGDGYGGTTIVEMCDAQSGYTETGGDCDDNEPLAYPGGTEYCDGVNNDCDRETDEDDALDVVIWYLDTDGDGYGNSNRSEVDCDAPSGYANQGGDCDDSVAAVNPGAAEYCDNMDNNCDGTVDDGSAVDSYEWYLDADSDGYGGATIVMGCTRPAGTVGTSTDCNDSDAATYPGATEIPYDGIDQSCDGADSCDLDNDSYESTLCGGQDCDDSTAQTSPLGTERCDGVDNNCDGTADENSAIDASTWYLDGDGDGYGSTSTEIACNAPVNYVGNSSDCEDSDNTIYPGATEIPYDGIDQDCDSVDSCDVDGDGFDGLDCGGDDCEDEDDTVNPDATEVWYDDIDQDCLGDNDFDQDKDGYDSASYGGTDCDDANEATWPGAPDNAYDGVINDCNAADEFDVDGDGFDSSTYGGTDCDDSNSDIRPDAAEIWYDGIDQNCDGADDFDADGDGYASAEYGGDDCDDASAGTYPGAPDEPYDGIISDCNEADEYDVDGDGMLAASGGGADCDDSNSAIYPGASELIDDGVDSDCDGGELCLVDADEDGQLELTGATVLSADLDCLDAGEGEKGDMATDCNDTDASSYLGAAELCDGVDNSCDGTVDEGCAVDSGDSNQDSVSESATYSAGDSEQDSGKEEPACGCSTGNAGGLAAGFLIGGLLIRRRKALA
jgi:hypothetical protein